MLLVMAVSLYTSRVILEVLGITNYGIYQVVGGIVGFLAFINVALSTGTSRFLTFELGKGIGKRLSNTFITSINVHILLVILIVMLAEPIGIWLIYHKLQIPENSFDAALVAFHWSIATVAVSIITVPYNASIISHENMSIFAYLGIFEVIAKLGVVYCLLIFPSGRLQIYAACLFGVQLIVFIIHVIYCRLHFVETRYRFSIDKNIFKEILSFSGWSLFSSSGLALNNQGILIVLNMFFSPQVVVARAISLQVNGAVNQFINNFRTAVNPQIVKLYASEEYDESRRLLLASTKYSFYMMLLLCLPLGILAKPILSLWLVEVPEYTVIFLQIILIQSLVQVFDNSFYTALYAKGQLKQNAILSPSFLFIMFPVVYVFFKLGYSPVALSWVSLATFGIIAFCVKPYLLIHIVDYNAKEIWEVIYVCLQVLLTSVPVPILMYAMLPDTILADILIGIICLMSVSLSVYNIGLSKEMQHKVKDYISKFLRYSKV